MPYGTDPSTFDHVVTLSLRRGRRNLANTERQGLHAEVPSGTADIFRAACHRAGTSLAELLRALGDELAAGRIVVPDKDST